MIIPFENIVYVDRYRVKVNYCRKNVGAKGNSNNETINRGRLIGKIEVKEG